MFLLILILLNPYVMIYLQVQYIKFVTSTSAEQSSNSSVTVVNNLRTSNTASTTDVKVKHISQQSLIFLLIVNRKLQATTY